MLTNTSIHKNYLVHWLIDQIIFYPGLYTLGARDFTCAFSGFGQVVIVTRAEVLSRDL